MYSVALKEKPHDDGLTRKEIVELFDQLNGARAIPIEVQGFFSAAMGFVNLTDAELIDYAYLQGSDLYRFIEGILNDQESETETGEYVFSGEKTDITIRIQRGE